MRRACQNDEWNQKLYGGLSVTSGETGHTGCLSADMADVEVAKTGCTKGTVADTAWHWLQIMLITAAKEA